MSPSEKAMESIKEAYADDLKDLQAIENLLVNYGTSIVNNLAIVSGALIAGSLVLLGSDIPVDRAAVVVGISTLIIEVVFIFLWLFHYHGKDTKKFGIYKKNRVSSTANILVQFDNLQQGTITEEQFKSELLQTATKIKSHTQQNNIDMANWKPYHNYWDLFFIILFGLGCVLIIVGLLHPYIHEIHRLGY